MRSSSSATRLLSLVVVAAALIGWTTVAQAIPVPLAPAGTVASTPVAGPPAGAIPVNSTTQNFASQDMPLNPNGTSFTGQLTSSVWANYPGNLFGPGALTFTYLLTNNGPDSLHRLTTTNFAGYLTDVEHDIAFSSPAGIAASSVDRDVTGKIIGWNYDVNPRLPGGSISALLIIHSNATQYAPSLASVINSATAGVLSYGPAPIPEPATLGALAGIVGLAVIARTRRAVRR